MTDQEESGPAPLSGITTHLTVEGMSCRNCARHVTEALQSVAGVAAAVVSLEEKQATVRWHSGVKASPSALEEAVAAKGFRAKIQLTEEAAHHDSHGGWRFNVVFGLSVTVPLFLGEWVFGWGMASWFQWATFILALAVQVLCGARFYRGAWNQIKVGESSMDTLVALGSTTAFGYSLWALFDGVGGHLYFVEAAAIITLISIGHWLEERMSLRAESSLRHLLNLAPPMARLLMPDGSEKDVPASQLRVKDRVVLRPGGLVPADGTLAEGTTSVNESMLTGESAPVDKHSGEPLYAGTINLNGSVVMEVVATGEMTALSRIIAAVQRAENSRANIQRLADRVSSVFVPIVVLTAVAAGLWWGLAPEQARATHGFLGHFLWMSHPPANVLAGAVSAMAAVLIVACPCAMGLATPAAIMAGANAAARRGILIRDGLALERAGTITAVIFDKTGTLTHGRPAVVASQVFAPQKVDSDHLKLAAAVARHSTHPLSQAVAQIFPDNRTFNSWREIAGSGVEAQLKGESDVVRLGSLNWLRNSGVDVMAGRMFEEKWMSAGASLLGLGSGKTLLLLIALQDAIKSGAADVMDELKSQGLKVFMITGDHLQTAKAVAVKAGIAEENVFAQVRPEQKAQWILQLQEKGERAAFVGDGINDAPALKQANLGIAVSRASDVAMDAADLVLLRSDIQAIPESIRLARASLLTIKQNLFWAFFYNSAAIPLAALGFLSPVICAAAMGFSDVIVIGNALRLSRRF